MPTILFADDKVLNTDGMILESVYDGTWVYSATRTGKIYRHSLGSKKSPQIFYDLQNDSLDNLTPVIFSLSVSFDKDKLAAGTSLGKVLLFQLSSGQLLHRLRIPKAENILVVRFIDENRLAIGMMDGSIALYQLKEGTQVYRKHIEYAPITNIQVSPGRKILAVASQTSILKLIDIDTGKIRKELAPDIHRDSIFGLLFLEENRLLSGSKDGSLRMWNLTTGEANLLFQEKGFLNIGAIAWDGINRIAFPLSDYRIGVMELDTKRIMQVLTGHTAFINSLVFLNQFLLVSSGSDANIIFHEVTK